MVDASVFALSMINLIRLSQILRLKNSLLEVIITAWKVSKYEVFSGPYFPVFGMNTEIYRANVRIQSEYRKMSTRKNSLFRPFWRSAFTGILWKSSSEKYCKCIKKKVCAGISFSFEVWVSFQNSFLQDVSK